MMHIAWPWMALLLPLPWLRYWLSSAAQPAGAALFVPMAAAVMVAGGAPTSSHLHMSWQRALLVAAWVLLVAASMRPQWLGEPQAVPSSGRRMMLAIDVSGSMATQDMADDASRLRVVQAVAGQFVDGRRGDRVGLILFGTRPYLQAPITADLGTVHRFLDEAVIGVAGPETAIGDAIGLAIKRLRAEKAAESGDDGKPGDNTVLVLLTDGQNDAGAMPPLEAARLAKQAGLRIYTIGVGAAADESLLGFDSGNTDLDESTLRAIARETGGLYFRATDANALQQVYRQIDRLEPVAGRDQWLRPTAEWFAWPLAAALLLSIAAAGGRARRWA
jgi:Ca-activated chloride channel family protein